MTRIVPATANREINRPLDSILVVKVLSHFLGSCYNPLALYQSTMLASAKQDSLSLVAQGFEIDGPYYSSTLPRLRRKRMLSEPALAWGYWLP